MHSSVMAKRSEFFRAARSERWTSETKPTELHEHDPSIFDLYLHGVYHNTLPTMPLAITLPPLDENGRRIKETPQQKRQRLAFNEISIDSQLLPLVKLYILSDSLLDPTTANLAVGEINTIGWKRRHLPGAAVLDLVFSNTRENDGLRNLLVDFYVYVGRPLPEGDFPHAFLLLFADRVLAARFNDYLEVNEDHLNYVEEGGCDWAKGEYHQSVYDGYLPYDR